MSGLAALGVGLALGALQGEGSSGLFAGLLVGGAVLWFAAAAVFGRIVELPGATEGGANGVVEAFARLTLLRDDRPFRAFVIARALAMVHAVVRMRRQRLVIARALAMGSGLAAPFYVALAREELGDAPSLLGVFIAVEGLAGRVQRARAAPPSRPR